MNKIFERVMEDYKRCNAAAKERMITKYGFRNEKEFFEYLKQPLVKVVSTKPRKKAGGKEPKVVSPKVETITDMVIAFDTTGSMSSYLNSVRKHVVETIGNLFTNTPNLKLKIVAFGDYCDMVNSTTFGKAYQETQLTDNQTVLKEFVKGAHTTSGGDSEEFYELVLKKILDETPWREGSKRAILLIADDNPHEVGYACPPKVTNARIDWRQEAIKANELKVRIDTLRIHSHITWYQELSSLTEGTCMDFKSSSKTQKIVEASTYLNSFSEKGIGATKVMYKAAMDAGDEELTRSYKGMAADRGINLDE